MYRGVNSLTENLFTLLSLSKITLTSPIFKDCSIDKVHIPFLPLRYFANFIGSCHIMVLHSGIIFVGLVLVNNLELFGFWFSFFLLSSYSFAYGLSDDFSNIILA